MKIIYIMLPPKKTSYIQSVQQEAAAQEEKRWLDNARKAKLLADQEFPKEKWKPVENGIFISPRRVLDDKVSQNELRDAQILRDSGSTVYLVPYTSRNEKRHYDAIVDGMKMEFKNVGGTPGTLESAFLKSRSQAENVFINLETSNMTRHEATSALITARNSVTRITKNGSIRRGYDELNHFNGGRIILKMSGHENLLYLIVDELKTPR